MWRSGFVAIYGKIYQTLGNVRGKPCQAWEGTGDTSSQTGANPLGDTKPPSVAEPHRFHLLATNGHSKCKRRPAPSPPPRLAVCAPVCLGLLQGTLPSHLLPCWRPFKQDVGPEDTITRKRCWFLPDGHRSCR